ncbi:CAAX prenyl protease-like protein [Dysgonomonas alginatilytica]|uniref:CAAX prenyl protease-like protein n=1 Tax=Dysgonomonas alginatilytica TaxID=1605892 RepID=A0A2V3PVM7_9BACT|nr:CPBP family intramembrane glutamic endopeptidase [Dysgonomonas alginatilytica]PXV69182.1 CAAX prenyl protease-like protein [Dysgonomonas alginatilytica]
MNKNKLKLWLCLSLIGLLGVVSLLLSDLPLPDKEAVAQLKDIDPLILKFMLLVNPFMIVTAAAFLGSLVYDKVGLRVPLFERMLKIREDVVYSYRSVFVWGVTGGVIAGLLIVVVNSIFTPLLPSEYLNLPQSGEFSMITKLLYGGLVEEIMMRFGLMSLLVWLLSKAMKGVNGWMFWVANIVSALLFGLGHFPALLTFIPDPTIWLYIYILLANSVAGIVFGYMYMKWGLECAMCAHLMAHVVMYIML